MCTCDDKGWLGLLHPGLSNQPRGSTSLCLQIPTGEEIAMDEQDLEELQETLQEDYEVG